MEFRTASGLKAKVAGPALHSSLFAATRATAPVDRPRRRSQLRGLLTNRWRREHQREVRLESTRLAP